VARPSTHGWPPAAAIRRTGRGSRPQCGWPFFGRVRTDSDDITHIVRHSDPEEGQHGRHGPRAVPRVLVRAVVYRVPDVEPPADTRLERGLRRTAARFQDVDAQLALHKSASRDDGAPADREGEGREWDGGRCLSLVSRLLANLVAVSFFSLIGLCLVRSTPLGSRVSSSPPQLLTIQKWGRSFALCLRIYHLLVTYDSLDFYLFL